MKICVACPHGELLQDCERCRPAAFMGLPKGPPFTIGPFVFSVTESDTDTASWPLKSIAIDMSRAPDYAVEAFNGGRSAIWRDGAGNLKIRGKS